MSLSTTFLRANVDVFVFIYKINFNRLMGYSWNVRFIQEPRSRFFTFLP